MANIVSHLGQNYTWIAAKNTHNTFTITCTSGGSAFDLTNYTFTLNIKNSGGSSTVLALTQGSGITNGGSTGVVTIALTETQSGTTLPGDTYFYELLYDVGGLTYAFIQGILTLASEKNPDSSATSLSVTINLAGTNVTAAITSGSVTSSAIATALGYTAAKQIIQVACSDETTALTAGTGKATFRMPHAMTVSAVRASLTTAQTSGTIFTVDINDSGTSILSTKLTIDNTEKTSTTAATAAVISDTALADDAEITVDIDQIGDGTAKGLKITLIGS
ncbi:MAG: hypothetical protein KY428_11680 [Bacteroidetes bacterium]|nr:hypothetical protein [Bacteroidota bacterium]